MGPQTRGGDRPCGRPRRSLLLLLLVSLVLTVTVVSAEVARVPNDVTAPAPACAPPAEDGDIAAREAAVACREAALEAWEARLVAWEARLRAQGTPSTAAGAAEPGGRVLRGDTSEHDSLSSSSSYTYNLSSFAWDVWRQHLDIVVPSAAAAARNTWALWINLDRRADRRNATARLLAASGMADCSLRVPAVDGRRLSRERCLQALTADARGGFEAPGRSTITRRAGRLVAFHGAIATRGVVGVALSHRRLWRMLIANNLTAPPLLLEDDVVWAHPLLQGIVERGVQHLDTRDAHWDVWYVSYHGCHASAADAAASGGEAWGATDTRDRGTPIAPTDAYYYSGLFSYVVNGPAAAAKLLNLWPLPPGQVDKLVYTHCYLGGLRCYRTRRGACPTFTPLSEATGDSDVQTFAEEE